MAIGAEGAGVIADPAAVPAPDATLVVVPIVNGSRFREPIVLLRASDGTLRVSSEDLARLGIVLAAQGAMVELATIPGARVALDPRKMTLEIDVPVALLRREAVTAPPARKAPPLRSNPGVFANYDVYASQYRGAGESESGLSARTEIVAFGPLGSLSNEVLFWRDKNGGGVRRIATNFAKDFPEHQLSLMVGDLVSPGSAWAGGLRFRGIQFGTDLATDPMRRRFAEVLAEGHASMPSVVDVLVNGSLVTTQAVKPGTFSIDRIPAVSGQGEVSLVVRDETGREMVFTRPYLESPSILSRGESTFQLNAGTIDASDRARSYPFASAEARYGVTSNATLVAGAEAGRSRGSVALGSSFALDSKILSSLGIARSFGHDARGTLGYLSVDYAPAKWRAAVHLLHRSSGYRALADVDAQFPILRQSSSLTLGYTPNAHRTLGLALTFGKNPSGESRSSALASYTERLTPELTASLSLLSQSGSGRPTAYFSLTWAIDDWSRVALGATSRDGRDVVEYSRRSAARGGWDYRIAVGRDEVMAAGKLGTPYGEFGAEAARDPIGTRVSMYAYGSVVAIGPALKLTTHISDSFLVASTRQAGLVVGNSVGETVVADSDGVGIISKIPSYVPVTLRVDPRKVSSDMVLPRREIELAVPRRSGAWIDFGIRPSRAISLHLLDAFGSPVAPGATVRTTTVEGEHIVGLGGLIYLADPPAAFDVEFGEGSSACVANVVVPADRLPEANIGTWRCRERVSAPRSR